eukprot:m.11862 g.11862  ORF g.11862 m.11862 type:complete len:77 (-) comp9876_c0_seq1:1183-1413(-)
MVKTSLVAHRAHSSFVLFMIWMTSWKAAMKNQSMHSIRSLAGQYKRQRHEQIMQLSLSVIAAINHHQSHQQQQLDC